MIHNNIIFYWNTYVVSRDSQSRINPWKQILESGDSHFGILDLILSIRNPVPNAA
jgi:hypothetical protein